jgi:hypothetical protein
MYELDELDVVVADDTLGVLVKEHDDLLRVRAALPEVLDA